MGKPKRAAASESSSSSATASNAKMTANEEEQLHTAARSGDINAVQTICVTNPLSINSRDKHSRTPLHLAAWSGHTQVVDYLCKNKGDIGAAAMDDMGAIHFAAQKGHLEVVRILVTSGVSVKSCTRKGMTPLHFAAQGSYLELVKYLVKKGANINAKNKAGKTPSDLAKDEEVRSFLVEYKSVSSKSVPSGEEGKPDKAEPKLSSEDKMEDGEIARDGDEEDDSVKRKNSGAEIKEKLPEPKRAKVALNHLLTADDGQEEEENL